MVQLYRLLIALLARLILIGFGALLLYGASFYATILFNRDARELFTQIEANRNGLWLIAAIGSGFAIAGLVLLFFGVRGLWRRIQAGMPSEDEGRAVTSTGRLASAAVFGAGALLGLLRLTLLIYALGDQAMLAWTGVETNAVVSRKWDADWAKAGTNDPKRASHLIAFTFQTPQGATVEQETRVSAGLYHSIDVGSAVPVTYSPQDPDKFGLEFARPRAVLIDAFIWIGLISVGLWGVRRNLGSDDAGGGDAGRAVGPAPTPSGSIAAASARGGAGSPVRRQFGQRTP